MIDKALANLIMEDIDEEDIKLILGWRYWRVGILLILTLYFFSDLLIMRISDWTKCS
jgi:hypothetical protein